MVGCCARGSVGDLHHFDERGANSVSGKPQCDHPRTGVGCRVCKNKKMTEYNRRMYNGVFKKAKPVSKEGRVMRLKGHLGYGKFLKGRTQKVQDSLDRLFNRS